ncbi:MAG: glycosyltransferase [Hyphomicrobiales bacterium]|nr:MAG: glycosyltransferase [Hyphomicrobiales bacterium]
MRDLRSGSPTVSIVMPAFNSARFISDSVESVRCQQFQNWELIVSDDGSRDETKAIVADLGGADSRICLLASGANRGPAQARNAAIEAASGRYVAFLDSDDLWKPEKLARQISFMQKHDLAFTFSSYDRIDEGGRFINTHQAKRPVAYRDLLKSCVIGCLTAVYDTERIGKVYMPEVRGAEDFGLWLRILKKVDRAVPLPESLALYRVRDNSLSGNKLAAARYTWSTYRNVENLGLLRSSYYFAHYAAIGVFNTFARPLVARWEGASGRQR